MMDYRALPSGAFTMTNVHVPACLLGQDGDLVRTEISIDAQGDLSEPQPIAVDMEGALVLPCFTDMHTHLDKGHIWGRSPNPDGTFMGALSTVAEDRAARWSAEDVRRRMSFALRCAYAHGTRAIRTHLDSIPPQDGISFPLFRDMQAEWAGRIELQAVCLIGCDHFSTDGPFKATADRVAETPGGVLGMVTYPVPDLIDRLRGFFAMAAERGLAADFHVDETMDPSSETLRAIAETAHEVGFDAPITVGHCCSLGTQDEARALDTLDLVAQVGINVVSLPLCNLYLQDRHAGRTPRGRGITLVHEMMARDIPVAFASDNTRDPFYAYGDMDMVEVMREATRIGHLDHGRFDWVRAFTATPAAICGFDAPSLAPGAPADLVITRARSWNEFFSRPQSDRIVLRGGEPIDRTLPDYAELDDLMETPQ
jgi:cytosine deaminase